jgi:hypothetical protein
MQATVDTLAPTTLFDEVAKTRSAEGMNAFDAWNAYLADKQKRERVDFQAACDTALAKIQDKPAKVKAVKAPKEPKVAPVNNKKDAALTIYQANPDKNNGAIARLIAAELEITYANAYYYVTRVFKR